MSEKHKKIEVSIGCGGWILIIIILTVITFIIKL
jgi:hypothetical protein